MLPRALTTRNKKNVVPDVSEAHPEREIKTLSERHSMTEIPIYASRRPDNQKQKGVY
jgi:hypothetical protein